MRTLFLTVFFFFSPHLTAFEGEGIFYIAWREETGWQDSSEYFLVTTCDLKFFFYKNELLGISSKLKSNIEKEGNFLFA
jgi:hypothetical protein